MKGALLQLTFFGAEDLNLISNDDITNFKVMFKKHTPFAIENKELLFSNKPTFGSTSTVKILQDGDMLSKMYLQVDLPYDSTLDTTFWTNRVGFRLIKKVEFYIGNIMLERQYGLWMHIWSELSNSNEKKHILNNIVGPKSINGKITIPYSEILGFPKSFGNPKMDFASFKKKLYRQARTCC